MGSKMKLWKISQGENNGYDTYDSAVVAAETGREAQELDPRSNHYWKDGSWWFDYTNGGKQRIDILGTWTIPENVYVEYLGEAAEGTKAGVICASFNAG
jgi:hypothetical protein